MSLTKTSWGAGQGGFRQTQAWLHTWCGLWFVWLLYAVFLTGTLAVFEEPITHWMTPEHHAQEAASAGRKKDADVPLQQRLRQGLAYMAQQHANADMWELWPADEEGAGDLRVYWFDAKGQYEGVQLDPHSGAVVEASSKPFVRPTLGGHHFVDFHYELHAGRVGLWIVGIAALAMLVALVSGVITHRRIFKDFFTFRVKKGQRSWLDAHNAAAVLTLPFQLMIVYTGIVISCSTFMPAGIAAYFGTSDEALQAFQAALNEPPDKPLRAGQAMALPDLEPLVVQGQALIGQPVRAVVIDYPGDAAARIGVYGWNHAEDLNQRLSPTSGMALFSAATGEVLQVRLPGEVDGGTAALAQSVIGGMHMADFGGLPLRWLYFVCGLAGCAMLATGAILFVVKRRSKHGIEFGANTAKVYRMIEGLNVATIAGLAIACVGYLWANRLVPLHWLHRDDWELAAFFALWLLALVHGWMRAPAQAWREQFAALAALCVLLPFMNYWATGEHLLAYIQGGDWESAGVEVLVLSVGFVALGALAWMHRTPKTQQRKQPRAAAASASTEQVVMATTEHVS